MAGRGAVRMKELGYRAVQVWLSPVDWVELGRARRGVGVPLATYLRDSALRRVKGEGAGELPEVPPVPLTRESGQESLSCLDRICLSLTNDGLRNTRGDRVCLQNLIHWAQHAEAVLREMVEDADDSGARSPMLTQARLLVETVRRRPVKE